MTIVVATLYNIQQKGKTLHIMPLMPTHYIAQIRDHMDEHGLDSQAWLATFYLSKDLLHQPGYLIEYHQFEQLILAAVEECGQTNIGSSIGKRLSITSHGTLGFALLHCASLRQAIELCQRYIGIRTPLMDLTFKQDQKSFIIGSESYSIFKTSDDFLSNHYVSLCNKV